jgi:hypothetical protein
MEQSRNNSIETFDGSGNKLFFTTGKFVASIERNIRMQEATKIMLTNEEAVKIIDSFADDLLHAEVEV